MTFKEDVHSPSFSESLPMHSEMDRSSDSGGVVSHFSDSGLFVTFALIELFVCWNGKAERKPNNPRFHSHTCKCGCMFYSNQTESTADQVDSKFEIMNNRSRVESRRNKNPDSSKL